MKSWSTFIRLNQISTLSHTNLVEAETYISLPSLRWLNHLKKHKICLIYGTPWKINHLLSLCMVWHFAVPLIWSNSSIYAECDATKCARFSRWLNVNLQLKIHTSACNFQNKTMPEKTSRSVFRLKCMCRGDNWFVYYSIWRSIFGVNIACLKCKS